MKFSFSNRFRQISSAIEPKIFGWTLLTIALLLAGTAKAASPGAQDLSFGTRGAAFFSVSGTSLEGRAIVVQPDGKIVVAGYIRTCVASACNYDFLVLRYNTDGTPDTGFGNNGEVRTDFSGQEEVIFAAAVQSDGKVVVAGGGIGGTPSATNIQGFKLVRYNADGTLDSSFGTGGKVYESFQDLGGTAQTMLIQPDGKIVVAGTGQNGMLFMARFNPNGTLDTSFDTDGRVTSSDYGVGITKLALQADGKIVIAGTPNAQGLNTLKLIRFNTNGTPDTDFGMGGVVTDTFDGGFRPVVAVQSDGKILVSGAYIEFSRRSPPPLKRYHADGSADSSLVPNHGEIIVGACISCTQKAVEILLLPDGRFYLVGFSAPSNNSLNSVAISRYLPTGSLDPTFGFRGTSQFKPTNEGGTFLSAFNGGDAALQADGKIVLTVPGFGPNGGLDQRIYTIRVHTTVTAPSMRGDFDGDRKTDFAVFRPSTSYWYLLRSSDGSMRAERFGQNGDVITPGDYNYDLKTDLAIFRPGQNGWYISASQPSGGGPGNGVYGQAGAIPVPQDYDGDGYTDMAYFRPSNGTWNIRPSSLAGGVGITSTVYEISFPFGISTDRPVPADYDGDGRADFAVFRPSTGDWYILRSSDGGVTSVNFGLSTDQPVPGDYDGDLRTDICVYRDGSWYILRSSDNAFAGIGWGLSTDKPASGDYDGDGKYDVAVYRASEGAWYVLKSSDGGVMTQQWGISEDIPIPFAYLR